MTWQRIPTTRSAHVMRAADACRSPSQSLTLPRPGVTSPSTRYVLIAHHFQSTMLTSVLAAWSLAIRSAVHFSLLVYSLFVFRNVCSRHPVLLLLTSRFLFVVFPSGGEEEWRCPLRLLRRTREASGIPGDEILRILACRVRARDDAVSCCAFYRLL